MGTDKIILKWQKNNRYFKKEMKRNELMQVFEGYILKYDINEISKKLVKIIPKAVQLEINWDSTADVKQLYYVIDGKKKGLPIINDHSIVWGTWKKFCTDGWEVCESEYREIG